MTYCHSVFSLQWISFHLTPLWKPLFLVTIITLTMLHCVCGECELKQALMCNGTLFLSYKAERYMLRASLMFEERCGTVPDVEWNEMDANEFRVDKKKPSLLIVLRHPNMANLSKLYAWAPAVNGRPVQNRQCMLSVDTQGAPGVSNQANAACWQHYVRASVCMSMRVWLVLRVKRPEIMREGGHFHSCKSMLNTSLPLEQLPYSKQLYGWGRLCWG